VQNFELGYETNIAGRIEMTDFPLAIDLARMQFASTVSFHIFCPAFSIGLASYLAVLEAL